MVQVKICGITNIEDAEAALKYGADALGFICYKKSKRYIPASQIHSITQKLPLFTVTVGVFVNPDLEEIHSVVKDSGIRLVQLSGDESPSFVRSLNYPVIKTLHIGDDYNYIQKDLDEFGKVIFLLDSSVSYGGSGVLANWKICKKIANKNPVILAGGLTPENVSKAINYIKPVAVDVSSGVEKNAVKKDLVKIQRFISNVKKLNKSN